MFYVVFTERQILLRTAFLCPSIERVKAGSGRSDGKSRRGFAALLTRFEEQLYAKYKHIISIIVDKSSPGHKDGRNDTLRWP